MEVTGGDLFLLRFIFPRGNVTGQCINNVFALYYLLLRGWWWGGERVSDYGILNHIVMNSVHSVWYTQIIFSLVSLCHKAGTYKPMYVKPAVNLDGTMKVWIIHLFHSCPSPASPVSSWICCFLACWWPWLPFQIFQAPSIKAFLCSLVVLSLDKPSKAFSVLILLVVLACQYISL